MYNLVNILKLKDVFLELTDECNLKCPHCVSILEHNISRTNKKMYSKDKYIKLVHEIIDMEPEGIYFHGLGEPTCFPFLSDIIEIFFKNNIKVSLLSNFARRFTEREIELFANFYSIRISFDAATHKLSKEIRGGLNLDIFLSNILRIKASAIKQGKSPFWSANITLTNLNMYEIENIFYLANACGIYFLDFFKAHLNSRKDIETRNGRLIAQIDKIDQCQQADIVEQFKIIFDKSKENGMHINLFGCHSNNIEDMLLLPKNFIENKKLLFNNKIPVCLTPWKNLYIDCNGNMYNCCYQLHLEKYSYGNVFEIPLYEAINSENVLNMRKNFLHGKMQEACNVNCPQISFSNNLNEFHAIIYNTFFSHTFLCKLNDNYKSLNETTYAIWGTGGRCQNEVIPFLEEHSLLSGLKFFIDSNSNKQGQTLHNKSIFSPDCLKNNPVDAIIIATCYEDEVLNKLSQLGITNCKYYIM